MTKTLAAHTKAPAGDLAMPFLNAYKLHSGMLGQSSKVTEHNLPLHRFYLSLSTACITV